MMMNHDFKNTDNVVQVLESILLERALSPASGPYMRSCDIRGGHCSAPTLGVEEGRKDGMYYETGYHSTRYMKH